MIIDGTKITMVRGDSETITVSIQDKNGVDVPLVTGDTIYFTVKTSTRTDAKLMQKVVTDFDEGKAIVEIEPADTKDLDYGSYVYDVQLTDLLGKVTTIIPPSEFVIGDEVTYE